MKGSKYKMVGIISLELLVIGGKCTFAPCHPRSGEEGRVGGGGGDAEMVT